MELSIKKFSDYVRGKDNQTPYQYSEPIPPKSISADVEDDNEPHGLTGSPSMNAREQPPLTRVDKTELATPEFKKGGALKPKFESVEKKEVINEGRDEDLTMRSIDGGKYTPPMHEVSAYSAKIMAKHPMVAERMIRDMKRHGSYGHFMTEAMNHPETYGHMIESFGHAENGPKHSRKFAKALDDNHAKYMQDHFGGFSEAVDAPRGDMGSLSPASNPLPGTGGGFGMTQPSMAQSPTPTSTPMAFSMAANNQSSMSPPPGMDAPPASESKKMAKLAHDHLLESMSKYPYAKNYLRESMGY